jgi:hypothetical protein
MATPGGDTRLPEVIAVAFLALMPCHVLAVRPLSQEAQQTREA